MESNKNSVLQEDLEYIAECGLDFSALKKSTVMITGATGLVGSMLVRTLACLERKRALGIRILILVRSEKKAQDMFGELLEREGIDMVVGDVTRLPKIDEDVDFIIHGASVTASKQMIEKPAETLDIAYTGTKNILELAREKSTRSMVYLSSMEAFGVTDSKLECVREKDLGYIDITSIRSSYSEGKRVCELMCRCYAEEYGVNVKTARLAQTFGAGVPESDNRVFAQFARSAMAGEDIVLHTRGESVGNYCYTADSVRGILTVLIKGETGETYTVANPETSITIKDMAHMVAESFSEGKSKVVFDIPETNSFGYAPDVKMRLNADKLMELGWSPKYGLRDMYERLIAGYGTGKS